MYRDIRKSVKSIEKYSKKDAQSWEKIFDNYLKNKDKIIHSLNTPPYQSLLSSENIDNINRKNRQSQDWRSPFDYRYDIQSLRSWCSEYLESEEVRVFFGAWAAHVSASPDDAGSGSLAHLFSVLVQDGGNNVVKGEMINLPLALARYLQAKGGHILAGSGVSRIIIKDKKAVGVKLENGRNIGVKKLVVSSNDPLTLVFNLIGDEYFDSNTLQSIKHYKWGDAILTMYLALDSQMEYIAGLEALQSTHLHFSEPSIDYFSKIFYESRNGILPQETFPIVSNDSIADPSRVPHGKHLMKFLISSVPYRIKSYNKNGNANSANYNWDEVKSRYSDNIIDMISQKYIPNLKSILKKIVVFSPMDLEKKPTTSVQGTLACEAMVPYQMHSMRPVPEFAGYKIPAIPNIYLCGSSNHPGPGVSMAPGRNAAQIIFADFGLDFSNILAS